MGISINSGRCLSIGVKGHKNTLKVPLLVPKTTRSTVSKSKIRS